MAYWLSSFRLEHHVVSITFYKHATRKFNSTKHVLGDYLMMERPKVDLLLYAKIPKLKPVGHCTLIGLVPKPEVVAPSYQLAAQPSHTSHGEPEERRFIFCTVKNPTVNLPKASAYYTVDVDCVNPERSKLLPSYSHKSIVRNLRPADIGEDGSVYAFWGDYFKLKTLAADIVHSLLHASLKVRVDSLASPVGARKSHLTPEYPRYASDMWSPPTFDSLGLALPEPTFCPFSWRRLSLENENGETAVYLHQFEPASRCM